jgi:Cu/Zn superoxide dismutase
MDIHLTGFKNDKRHAIHIHEYGDLRQGCTSLGGHWNPYNKEHGGADKDRHAGDLMNNIIPHKREVHIHNFICGKGVSLYGERSIIGRSIVIHNKSDDLGLKGLPLYSKENPYIPESVLLYKDMSESELRNIVTRLTKEQSILHGSRRHLIEFLEKGSKTTGNAGGRIACGVIGHAYVQN